MDQEPNFKFFNTFEFYTLTEFDAILTDLTKSMHINQIHVIFQKQENPQRRCLMYLI